VIEFALVPNYLISAKNIYFIFSGGIFLIVSSFYIKRLSVGLLDIYILIFVCYVATNSILKSDQLTEFLILFLTSSLSFLVIAQLFRHSYSGSKLKSVAILTVIVSLSYQVIYGQLQLLGYLKSHHILFSITGSFANPGPYAIFLVSALSYVMADLIFKNPGRYKWPLWIVLVLSIGVLPATKSRSAWMALTIAALFLFYSYFRKQSSPFALVRKLKSIWKIGLPIIVSILISLGLYLLKPDSVSGRIYLWERALKGSSEFRYTGLGYGNLEGRIALFQIIEGKSEREYDKNQSGFVQYAFNDYLQIFLENGIFGLLIFLLILITLIKKGTKVSLHSRDPILFGALGSLLSILFSAFFSYPFEVIPIWVLFLFGVSLINGEIGDRDSYTIKSVTGINIFRALICLLSFFVLYLNENIFRCKSLVAKADTYLMAGEVKQAITLYKEAMDINPAMLDILPGYGKALFLDQRYAESVTFLKKASKKRMDPVVYCNLGDSYSRLGLYDEAEKCYRFSISLTPKKIYPRYLLAKMYFAKGDSANTIKEIKWVLNSPTIRFSPAESQIRLELQSIADEILRETSNGK